MERPFIDFYNSQQTLPVRQNISDPRFLDGRSFLYSRLGIPLRFLKGMEIIEFGPGGGFNATATSKYKPGAYYFVEGSELGVLKLQELIRNKSIEADEILVHFGEFLEYSTDKKFDLVIAEACIPGQFDPSKFLRHICGFVKKDGLIVITTTSKSSMFSEILRALYGFLIKDKFDSKEKYKKFLELKFESHLSHLGTNRRSTEDWVLDNIVHNWHKHASSFSLLEASKLLTEFEFQASMPNFLMYLSWYKTYKFDHNKYVEELKQIWSIIELQVIDCRVKKSDLMNLSLEESNESWVLLESIFNCIHKVLNNQTANISTEEIEHQLFELSKLLPPVFGETKKSIFDFLSFLSSQSKLDFNFSSFEPWWGRGQQYATFRRVK